MTNHVHLLLTSDDAVSISKTMHSVSRAYAAYFNAHQDRVGMLWQERFFAANITTEQYLFACYRYIDTNPVRAGMVADPGSYPWSSHRFHAAGARDCVVTPHSAYIELSSDCVRRQSAYRNLFVTPLSAAEMAEIREASLSGRDMGTQPRPRGRPRKEMVRGTIF